MSAGEADNAGAVTIGYLGQVLAARDTLLGPAPEPIYDRLEREEAELEAALEEAIQQDPVLGLEAALLLRGFWFQRGRVEGGRRWFDRLLEVAPGPPSPSHAQGLIGRAVFAFRQGDNATEASSEAAIEEARALGRQDLLVDALLRRSEEGLRDADPPAVRRYGTEARRLSIELADERSELSAIHRLAEGARITGDLDEARALYVESLERSRTRGDRLMEAVELSNLGAMERDAGHLGAAEALLLEAIGSAIAFGSVYLLANDLVHLGTIVAAAGRNEEAARLLGKGDDLLRSAGLMLDPADKPAYDNAVQTARSALGAAAFDAAHIAGVELDPRTIGPQRPKL